MDIKGKVALVTGEYSTAKAGLIRLTAVLAPPAERDGVRVKDVGDWDFEVWTDVR